MYIRVSSMSIIRAGRKFSRISTLIAAMLIVLAFLFLLTLISSDHPVSSESEAFNREGENKSLRIGKRKSESVWEFWFSKMGKRPVHKEVNKRISNLRTWSMNQSVLLEDYLDPTDPNSFLRQPRSRKTVNGTSFFCGPDVQVLIMVASAPSNLPARMAIRETWGSNRNLWTKGGRILFVLGSSGNSTIEEDVANESAKYGDILEEDFHDSYHNLTLKSVSMLKWANLTCSIHNTVSMSPRYVLKTDDDMFINFDRLLRVIKDMPNAKMIGRLTCGAVPVGDPNSKLYMPKYLYPAKVYPGYLSGTSYLLRSDIIPTLLNNALTTPLVHLEDIYVTGLLAGQSHIFPDDSSFFTYNRIEPKDNCAFRFMVNSHQMTVKEMHLIWSNLKKPPPIPCTLRKAKWLRRVPKMNKRLNKLCLFR